MVRTILRVLLASPIIIVLLLVVVVNIRLHLASSPSPDQTYKELIFLQSALNDGADEDMQRFFPEGYVFLNALYGLAWYNYGVSSDRAPDRLEAQAEIDKAWRRINSPLGRGTFQKELPLEYGAFYRGWNNYLLGKKLTIEKGNSNPADVEIFRASCDSIAQSLEDYTYPMSYYGLSWPADVLMCVASLSVHDKLYTPRYSGPIQHWITNARERLDVHGLIPHAVIPKTGQADGTARGSSQSLMLIILREVDENFAREQFAIYYQTFVDTVAGLTGVREYPRDATGSGDIDSGPVVLGLGSAATIVGMHTLTIFGNGDAAGQIFQLIDAVGLPSEVSNQRRYLFGRLPMADAFIAWGHSAAMDLEVSPDFLTFHLLSAFVVALLGAFVWILIKPDSPDSTRSLTVGW